MIGGAFQTRASGKWVLAGEHAVLRGMPAVALPHPELGLSLRFEPRAAGEGLEVRPSEIAADLKQLLVSVAGPGEIPGLLRIESTIPLGAGLGSSAALCVAVTRWLSEPLGLSPDRWLEFATRLEDRFHGKSSGMDVAVILAGEPVRFVRGQGGAPLGLRKLPRFTFHDTGLRARTSDCIARVETLGRDKPALGRELDLAMGAASEIAVDGLRLFDAGEQEAGLSKVAEAMTRGQQCLEGWGLVPPAARELQRALRAQGARATRLTGAGGGGMIVALWAEEESQNNP